MTVVPVSGKWHAVMHDPQCWGGVVFRRVAAWSVTEHGLHPLVVSDDGSVELADKDDLVGIAEPGDEVGRHWEDAAAEALKAENVRAGSRRSSGGR